MELFADEGRTTGPNTAIIRRPKPELLVVGSGRTERQLCSTGRFNAPLAADYLIAHRREWTETGKLARIFYGANTPENKRRVRKHASELFNYLLAWHKAILLYEYHGQRIGALKIFDRTSEADRQALMPRIDRMSKASRWTQEQEARIKSILTAEEQLESEKVVS